MVKHQKRRSKITDSQKKELKKQKENSNYSPENIDECILWETLRNKSTT